MENGSSLATGALGDLCRQHLPHVSRTFALTIPVLKEPLQSYVGLAYLLCRVADTAEDHPHLDQDLRDQWLIFFDKALRTRDAQGIPPRPKWIDYPDPHYQALFQAAPKVFRARTLLPHPVRHIIDACLLEMVQGMREFPGRDPNRPILACQTLEVLDRYCHIVAGTVGILLTQLFALRLDSDWAHPQQLELGRQFGLGLQMVNILKDRTGDKARGVSYCPNLEPKTPAGLPVQVVQRALDHLAAGYIFMQGIPEDSPDLQEFCIIPHTLALATLRHLLQGNPKIPRQELPVLLAECRDALKDPEFRKLRFTENQESVAAHLRALPQAVS